MATDANRQAEQGQGQQHGERRMANQHGPDDRGADGNCRQGHQSTQATDEGNEGRERGDLRADRGQGAVHRAAPYAGAGKIIVSVEPTGCRPRHIRHP